jgi:hypothetical protein
MHGSSSMIQHPQDIGALARLPPAVHRPAAPPSPPPLRSCPGKHTVRRTPITISAARSKSSGSAARVRASASKRPRQATGARVAQAAGIYHGAPISSPPSAPRTGPGRRKKGTAPISAGPSRAALEVARGGQGSGAGRRAPTSKRRPPHRPLPSQR